MKRKRIVCVAPEDDDHGKYLEYLCNQLGVEFLFLDIGKADAKQSVVLRLSEGDYILNGVNLSPEVVIWWRRPYAPKVDGRLLDARFKTFSIRQWDLSIRSSIELCGSAIVNNPTNERLAECKPLQLKKAEKLGFHVAKTIITNSPDEAKSFISYLKSYGKRCIFKPLSSGRFHLGETRIINKTEGIEEELRLAPVIFQECIEKGSDIRVTYFGDRVYGTRIVVTHDDMIDWRLDPAHRYEPIEVNPKIREQGFLLLAELGLQTGSFDFRIDKNGDVFFFEVNPSGQFLYLSEFGFPDIGKDFVKFLLTQ